MDWTAPVDLYCERTAAGLANEPLNAATNLAFWLAALLVARWCRRRSIALDAELAVLWWMLWAIGAGSLALHTLANRAGGVADTLAILLYLHIWSVAYLRRVWHCRWRHAWLGIPAFLLATSALSAAWRAVGLQPAGYLAAWTVLLVCSAAALQRDATTARRLAVVAAVFALSMTLRQLDLPLCAAWPHGTHFAWHLLNAVVLGLSLVAVAAARPAPARRLSA